MIRYLLLTLAILVNGAVAIPEVAPPEKTAPADQTDVGSAVKIINFTADWCPNCRALNPKMAEAVERFEVGDVRLIDLDHTGFKGADEWAGIQLTNKILKQMDAHQAVYLWDWYGGRTGIAVVVASDNGEPLTCFNNGMTVDQIEARIKQSITLATKAPPGLRRPEGPECPPPMN